MKATCNLPVRIAVAGEPLHQVDLCGVLYNKLLSEMVSEHADSVPSFHLSARCFKYLGHLFASVFATDNVLAVDLCPGL